MSNRAYRSGLSALLLAMSIGAAAAPDAAAIMKKAAEAMSKAKTYQSEWRMVVSMGTMGSMTLNMTMKMTNDGKAFVKTEPSGQGTGMMAAGAAMASSTTVSDGKTMYMYMKAMNSYMKMPVPKDSNPAISGQFGALNQKDAAYKLVGSEYVRGRKCYVIDVKPKMPTTGPGAGMKPTVTAYVDEQTGRLRQMKTRMTMPGGPPGPSNGQGNQQKPTPMVMTSTMVLLSEKINAPIPASTFKFTPPAGAREMQGGMMGGPGGPPMRGPGPGGASPR